MNLIDQFVNQLTNIVGVKEHKNNWLYVAAQNGLSVAQCLAQCRQLSNTENMAFKVTS